MTGKIDIERIFGDGDSLEDLDFTDEESTTNIPNADQEKINEHIREILDDILNPTDS